MKICESLYYYLLSPKEAIKKNINFEYSLIIYLITALTVSISVLYSIGSKSNILNLFIITFGIASYIAISNIIKIAIINFTVFIFSKDNDKNNLRIITNDIIIANYLFPYHEVYILGGFISKEYCSASFNLQDEFINSINVDLLIMGISAISNDGILSSPHLQLYTETRQSSRSQKSARKDSAQIHMDGQNPCLSRS